MINSQSCTTNPDTFFHPPTQPRTLTTAILLPLPGAGQVGSRGAFSHQLTAFLITWPSRFHETVAAHYRLLSLSVAAPYRCPVIHSVWMLTIYLKSFVTSAHTHAVFEAKATDTDRQTVTQRKTRLCIHLSIQSATMAYSQALSMHPPTNGTASVCYDLAGEYTTFDVWPCLNARSMLYTCRFPFSLAPPSLKSPNLKCFHAHMYMHCTAYRQGAVALDDSAAGSLNSTVLFRVKVDDKLLWESKPVTTIKQV